MINVLITSAGRRVELVNCFKDARDKMHIEGKVIAADIDNTAPALYHADKHYLISRVKENGFIQDIINICNKENIHLIVPTIDTELYKLAENKELIQSETKAKVLISDKEVINICRNKYNTYKFFIDNKIGTPKIISKTDLQNKNYKFPLFIKPLDGSSSINAFKINNERELNFFKDYVPNPIVQEYVHGDEYTIDIFTDFDSNPITIVPRLRLATRGGEVSKGIVKKDKEIINEVKRIINALKPIGHITIQCIKTLEGIYFIEINPRFGGGAPISIKAGANSAENLYKLILGESLEYNEDYEDGLLGLRYDNAVFLDSEKEIVK